MISTFYATASPSNRLARLCERFGPTAHSEGERKLQLIAEAMQALDCPSTSFFPALPARAPNRRARRRVLHARKNIEFSDSLIPGGSTDKLVELLNRLKPRRKTFCWSGTNLT